MKDSQGARWLLHQLPALIAKGVLNEDAAESLRAHYQPAAAPTSSRNAAMIIFSVMGGLLISAGIILLFAHNWEELDRPARAVLSFVPLLLGIGCSAWALWKKSDALAEGAGAFHTLAIGACIALIGQTYQLPGNTSAFLLAWMFLALPLVYLLRSAAAAMLYLAGITTWAGAQVAQSGSMLWFWPMAALVLPFYALLLRENRFSGRAWWLSLALALALPVSAGLQCERAFFQTWPLLLGGVFTVFYLLGCGWFRKADAPSGGHPFIFIGQIGIVGLTIMLSYRFFWQEQMRENWFEIPHQSWVISGALGYGFCGLALCLYALGWLRRTPMNPVAGLLPLLVALSMLLLSQGFAWPLVLMNLYAFALGVVTIVRGLRDLRFASLNAGLLLLGTLVVSRFFDEGISFILKGVAFIVIGAGFCAANVFLLKKRKETA